MERLNIFGIFFLCSQPYKKSDGNSNRKIQGNETVVQGYTLVHIFIPSIQRNYFTEDVIKERKKAGKVMIVFNRTLGVHKKLDP